MNEIEADTYNKMSPEERESSKYMPFIDTWRGGLLADVGALLYMLPREPCNVLDVGVASGWSSWMFAMAGHTVLGIDLSKEWIAMAKKQWKLPNLSYKVADYVVDKFPAVEAIVMHDTLHHAEDEYKWIQRAYNLLPHRGFLITCEPGSGHSKDPNTIKSVEKYGNIEKDMPVNYIQEMGLKAGFSRAEVFPSAKQLMYLAYVGCVNVDTVYRMDTGIVRLTK